MENFWRFAPFEIFYEVFQWYWREKTGKKLAYFGSRRGKKLELLAKIFTLDHAYKMSKNRGLGNYQRRANLKKGEVNFETGLRLPQTLLLTLNTLLSFHHQLMVILVRTQQILTLPWKSFARNRQNEYHKSNVFKFA